MTQTLTKTLLQLADRALGMGEEYEASTLNAVISGRLRDLEYRLGLVKDYDEGGCWESPSMIPWDKLLDEALPRDTDPWESFAALLAVQKYIRAQRS